MIQIHEIEDYDNCQGCGYIRELKVNVEFEENDVTLCDECFGKLKFVVNMIK